MKSEQEIKDMATYLAVRQSDPNQGTMSDGIVLATLLWALGCPLYGPCLYENNVKEFCDYVSKNPDYKEKVERYMEEVLNGPRGVLVDIAGANAAKDAPSPSGQKTPADWN